MHVREQCSLFQRSACTWLFAAGPENKHRACNLQTWLCLCQGAPLKVEAPLDKAKKLAKVVLKQSSEARELALTLAGVKYGGDLEQQLAKHSTAVEELYQKLSQLVRDKCNDEKIYEPVLSKARPLVARLTAKETGSHALMWPAEAPCTNTRTMQLVASTRACVLVAHKHAFTCM